MIQKKIGFKNSVKLSNVDFYYNNKNKIILNNINLETTPGNNVLYLCASGKVLVT